MKHLKRLMTALLLTLIIGQIGAIDTESYQFINHLLNLGKPAGPEVFEDGVIFTAPSYYRRVGVAFAHEGFGQVYWFRKLLVVKDDPGAGGKKQKTPEDNYRDSGVLFHAYTPPGGLRELRYRLVIDGLWTADPANPNTRRDPQSGLLLSAVALPLGLSPQQTPPPLPSPPPDKAVTFRFQAPPGETVTLGGSFNGWDPFMYELRETSPGAYSLSLPLPPGTYQYVFFRGGERVVDPANSRRVYARDGTAASELVVR